NKANHVYLMAPNCPAGKETLAGVKHYYKGQIVGEIYTCSELGDPTQGGTERQPADAPAGCLRSLAGPQSLSAMVSPQTIAQIAARATRVPASRASRCARRRTRPRHRLRH